MTDYTKFDEALLEAIRQQPRAFWQLIDIRRIHTLADKLAKVDRWGYLGSWRVLDRRLQALRRAGKIRYRGKVWEAHDAD